MGDGLVTHIERVPADPWLAVEQHTAYVAALAGAGWEIVEVPLADEFPDSAFVEDTVVVVDRLAVVARLGADERLGEEEGVLPVLRALDLEVARIEAPGTLDGGDVLQVGNDVYVGRGGRTNADGIRQLRALLAPLGRTVVAVPLLEVLHLKSAITALPDGTIVCANDRLIDPSPLARMRMVPEEAGSHVVVLDPSTVLMAASAPRSAELFGDLGFDVVTVDISEFEKMEGCVTCLSVLVP
ncbi:MAG: NG,NG-dimethylarginine dimethylaminohydrolase 1 [uncultured Solirubrobacteraceae bacterium]|uniref:NG,NG-dimethylarginine dimethylaminohydrolase 1 n=1 Tax=uncultured Solirubrobacteraceae bacterium TaxID=1162706 RepID=A0A6J4RQX3_9ACTN|nr:MAG: NG,NG-dimethylarginine dimethylaminohydrolase 1 [uncultured Solirubrobacteraceae bacterium]